MKVKSYLKNAVTPEKRISQKERNEMNKKMDEALKRFNQKTGSWKKNKRKLW